MGKKKIHAQLKAGMENAVAAADVAAQPVVAAPQAPATLYKVLPPKRPLTGLKFGEKGNTYTHAMLADAAAQHGGVLTAEQAIAVCIAAQHKRFFGYAVRRLKVLQPVAPAQQVAVAA